MTLPLFQTQGQNPQYINPALVVRVVVEAESFSSDGWRVSYFTVAGPFVSTHKSKESALAEANDFADMISAAAWGEAAEDVHWDPTEVAIDPLAFAGFNATEHPRGLPGSSYLEWPENVVKWARDRDILTGSSPRRQHEGKLREEIAELMEAIELWEQGDPAAKEKAEDAIGDSNTVMRIIAEMMGLSWANCFDRSWDSIKNRNGLMIDGVFVKEEDLTAEQREVLVARLSATEGGRR